MSIKDDYLPYKEKEKSFGDSISDNLYSNLNLNNQNYQTVSEEIFCPKSQSSNSRKSENYDRN